MELLFPATFSALVLAHLAALVSPGQDFFLITGYAVRYRLRGCIWICVGVAAGNAIYIAIAILGWTGIRDNPWLFTCIQLVGACYLLWVGWKLLQSQPLEEPLFNHQELNEPPVLQQWRLGLASALLNPKNALFYLSLMTVILGADVTLLQQISCGIWMVLLVLGWDILLAALISKAEVQSMLQNNIHLIERGAALILMSFGLLLFAELGYSWSD